MMLIDKPIDLKDLQKDEDSKSLLGYIEQTIDNLYKENSKDGGALIVSINGAWGTGKSSYLRALGSLCKQKNYPFLLFEAWRYANEPDIFVALLENIYRILPSTDKVAKGMMKRIIKSISVASLVGVEALLRLTLNTGFKQIKEGFKLIEQELEREVTRSSKNRLKLLKLLNKIRQDKPFFLLIDDLDRLTPEKAFRLLEQLRFYFEGDGLIIVMAINDEVINEYAHKHHHITSRQLSESFLDKVFQFSFDLDYVSLNKLHLRCLDKKQKEVFQGFFEELGKPLPHRKWINIVNRFVSEPATGGKDATPQHLALCTMRELFPEFRYSYRRDQSILLDSESDAFKKCKERVKEEGNYDIHLFDALYERLKGETTV